MTSSEVSQTRSWTPGLREDNLLIYFVNLADNRGPIGADPDPTPNEFPRATSRHCSHLSWGPLRSLFTLDVRVIAIDGTWCRDCQLIEVSETGAQISVAGPPVIDAEMILLLTRFGSPVFRLCMRTSVDGALMEVLFHRDVVGKNSLRRVGAKPSWLRIAERKLIELQQAAFGAKLRTLKSEM
jgi:hypothetical protein